MTDSTNTPAATPKAKTVAEDMSARRIFATTDEAIAYLNASATNFSDFATIPFAGAGLDSEGDFDPAIYTESMAVMVATLKKVKGGVKAIVVAPVPTLDSLLADDTGRAWVRKIIEKELNHVAVRPLREVEDISTVIDQIPTTRDAYISSSRDGGGGIMETFNALFKQIIATLAAKIPVWNKARLVKGELKKAMESKGYAQEFYAALEDRGEGKDSLFVTALKLGVATSKAKGLDPTIFERWLESRDKKAFTPGTEDEGDELDIDDLTSGLLAEDAKESEAAPAPETAAPEPDATQAEPDATA